eukprot:TRINITY_DN12431_c1_g1_i1.p1 TRINITY_DN12431_c1_g1~~TRINITY_DN12431_c1_g1_i1.p1  ORF type:complete len:402 (-),score=60.67 TRINITY_DN12431_c1_g1_i1:81-1286(-)
MPPRFRPPTLSLTKASLPSLVSKLNELYECGAKLGEGSSATVLQAVRLADQKVVALKKSVNASDEENRMTLKREYELMSQFSHEAILSVFAFHDFPCSVSLCLELCVDGSMDSYVKTRGAFLEDVATWLGKQLLAGVSYLHAKRVVHRDIKPSNLLLWKDATKLKICDFGSAKQIGRESSSAMLTHRGTGLFSAPEQLMGSSWNERVDVWACGMSLFFATQAGLPFDAEKKSVRHALKSGTLPPIQWKLVVSEASKNLVERCLVVDPNLRPPLLELVQHAVFLKLKEPPSVSFASTTDMLPEVSFHKDDDFTISASQWQESRHSERLLRRLAEHGGGYQEDQDSSSHEVVPVPPSPRTPGTPLSPPRQSRSQGKHRVSKFFTTHGADHNFESTILETPCPC